MLSCLHRHHIWYCPGNKSIGYRIILFIKAFRSIQFINAMMVCRICLCNRAWNTCWSDHVGMVYIMCRQCIVIYCDIHMLIYDYKVLSFTDHIYILHRFFHYNFINLLFLWRSISFIKGVNCEAKIAPCRSSPCLNDGSCTDHVTTFTCLCPSGYYGNTCELDADECLSDPCHNSATCVDLVDNYKCICLSGFTGENHPFIHPSSIIHPPPTNWNKL